MTPSARVINADAKILACASWYVKRMGWPVFPCHVPIHDDAGVCIGCSCEFDKRSDGYRQYLESRGRGCQFDPNYTCVQPGKCPACAWGDRATTDEGQLRKWFDHPWKTACVATGEIVHFVPNLAVACGPANLLVLDADTYKNCYDPLPRTNTETPTQISGGGGEHVFFNRMNRPYGNSVRGLPPGIDIRGVGGYVLLCPSLHRTGRRYQWEHGYSPRDIDLAPIPGVLDTILAAANTGGRSGRNGVPLAPDSAAVAVSVGLVERVLGAAKIDHSDVLEWGLGRRIILDKCPFNPTSDPHADDSASFVVITADGRIYVGCHHGRCRRRIEETTRNGWAFIRQMAGVPKYKYPMVIGATL